VDARFRFLCHPVVRAHDNTPILQSTIAVLVFSLRIDTVRQAENQRTGRCDRTFTRRISAPRQSPSPTSFLRLSLRLGVRVYGKGLELVFGARVWLLMRVGVRVRD